MRDEINEDLGVRGGQGHTAGEIADLTWFWALFIMMVAVLFVLSGCAPSSRPTARNDGDRPDKPHWEELRQQFGGL